MKIFGDTFLFKDPIGWAQKSFGSKFNFWSWNFLHVAVGALTVYLFVKGTLSLYFVLLVVIVFIILQPFHYLYALRKLVLELKKHEKTSEGKDE